MMIMGASKAGVSTLADGVRAMDDDRGSKQADRQEEEEEEDSHARMDGTGRDGGRRRTP